MVDDEWREIARNAHKAAKRGLKKVLQARALIREAHVALPRRRSRRFRAHPRIA